MSHADNGKKIAKCVQIFTNFLSIAFRNVQMKDRSAALGKGIQANRLWIVNNGPRQRQENGLQLGHCAVMHHQLGILESAMLVVSKRTCELLCLQTRRLLVDSLPNQQ